MLRFVGHDKSGSESARANGNPTHTQLQSDKSADSEKSVTASQIFQERKRNLQKNWGQQIISAVF